MTRALGAVTVTSAGHLYRPPVVAGTPWQRATLVHALFTGGGAR